jgi:predicted PurR-regulated permease PerM
LIRAHGDERQQKEVHRMSLPASPTPAETPAETPPPAARTWSVSITARTIWRAVAIVAVALLVGFVLSKTVGVLLLLFLAIVLAEGMRPLVDGLAKARLPRPLAVVLIYVAGLAALAGIVWLLVQPVADQATALVDALPGYGAQLQALLAQAQAAATENPALAQWLSGLGSQATAEASRLLPTLISVPLDVLTSLFDLFLVLSMAYFWLASTPRLKAFVLGLAPADERERAAGVLAELGGNLGGYVRGTLAIMAVTGLFTGVGLQLLGVPYALLLALLTGLTMLIPFLGPWISGAAVVLVALAADGPPTALAALGIFAALQVAISVVLIPLVLSRAVKLNPLTVIVAVLMGAALLGLAGAVLAVPAAAVVQGLLMRVVLPALQHTPARPARLPHMAGAGVDPPAADGQNVFTG